LEKYVADAFKKITPFVYSRADSGSGKFHKEDVTLDEKIPLHIECKNQAELSLVTWWKQTLEGCPASKFPVLIYRLNYQPKPTVYMALNDFFSWLSDQKITAFDTHISIEFDEFMDLVKINMLVKFKIRSACNGRIYDTGKVYDISKEIFNNLYPNCEKIVNEIKIDRNISNKDYIGKIKKGKDCIGILISTIGRPKRIKTIVSNKKKLLHYFIIFISF